MAAIFVLALLGQIGVIGMASVITGVPECDLRKEACDCQYSHYHKREWCDWISSDLDRS